jgi:adenylate kinase family enzyme
MSSFSKLECEIVFFVGAPGSGKGTLRTKVFDDLIHRGFCSTSSAEMSYLLWEKYPEEMEKHHEAGTFVNDEFVVDVATEFIRDAVNVPDSCVDVVVLCDGFLRKPIQTRDILEHCISVEGIIPSVVYLNTSDEVALKRLTKRSESNPRPDDKEAGNRIRLFRQTLPSVFDEIKARNVPIIELDGNVDGEDSVFKQIQETETSLGQMLRALEFRI